MKKEIFGMLKMLFLTFLLLFNFPGKADDNQTWSNAEGSQSASCHEDFICSFSSFDIDSQVTEAVKANATLNESLFSSMDRLEEDMNRREQEFPYQNQTSNEEQARMKAIQKFIKLQLKRVASKRIHSRALRTTRRLSIAGDCLRPALVCIASSTTCMYWGDSGYDFSAQFHHIRKILMEGTRGYGSPDWATTLNAMGHSKGAVLLITTSRNILTSMNWFSNVISPRGRMEDSDCIFLVTDSKDDAVVILSESAWSASARYVVVIMKALSPGAYADGLYEEGTEVGVDIDEVVFPEFDLHHYEDWPKPNHMMYGDLWRRRRRRDLTNSTRTNDEMCVVSARNLLRLLWYNRRLLHTTVIHKGCNFSSSVGYIQGNVSTAPIHLLTHSGNLITLPGNAIAKTLEYLSMPLTNLGGRALRISLFERKPTVMLIASSSGGRAKFAGQDAWLLRLIARYLNFRVEVQEPEDFGQLFDNGTASGTFSHLLHGKADISFNGFLVMDYGTRALQFSSPFSFDALCVVVPRAAALPRWAALLNTLPVAVIAVTPPTILCLSLILTAMRRTLRFRGSAVGDMLSMVSVCLAVSTRMPNICSLRLLLIGATVAALVIAGAFQGLIVRSIALPRYPKQIDDLKALDESGLLVATGTETFKNTFYVPGGSVVMEHLYQKTILLQTKERENQYLGKVATIVRRAGIEAELTDQDHLVKECPRQYPVAFQMRRGMPFELPVDRLLLRCAAGGIIKMLDYWTHGFHKESPITDTPRKVFSIEDLEGPFIVLGCGLGLSTIVFLFEIRIIRCRIKEAVKDKRLLQRRATV